MGFTRYFHICTTAHHFRILHWMVPVLSSHLKSSYYPHCWWYWLKSFLLWNFTEPRKTNTYAWKLYYKHTLLCKAKYAKHNFEIMYIFETKEACASLFYSLYTVHIWKDEDRGNWQTLMKAVINFNRLRISWPVQQLSISQEIFSSVKLIG